MIFKACIARVLRAAALSAGLATALPAVASAQGETLVYRSADRTSASAAAMGRAADWKAVLVGGHYLIDGYNNAATDIAARLRRSGVQRVAVLHSAGSATGEAPATRREMRRAFGAMGSTASDACLVFVSSHGNRRGLYLSAEHGYLSPRQLSRIVDDACGERPTVLVLSGCDTGTFITGSLQAANRIIITATTRNQASYGASTRDRYVNFDRCMIRAMDSGARTWREMFARTVPCVGEREAALGVAASQPQAWFGTQVADLALPGR